MNKTKIIQCSCEHEYKDKAHGRKMRVTTPDNLAQSKGDFVVRFTVRGKSHNAGSLK